VIALALVLLSLTWLPLAGGDAELAHRFRLATAIVDAGTTPHEGRILMRIARFESNYRADVADCRVTGDAGRSVGPWQHYDAAPALRACICGNLTCAARVARDDVRRSVALCKHLPEAERLAAYTRGRCDSAEGKRLSRARWAQ